LVGGVLAGLHCIIGADRDFELPDRLFARPAGRRQTASRLIAVVTEFGGRLQR
jgi:hypothetical protein